MTAGGLVGLDAGGLADSRRARDYHSEQMANETVFHQCLRGSQRQVPLFAPKCSIGAREISDLRAAAYGEVGNSCDFTLHLKVLVDNEEILSGVVTRSADAMLALCWRDADSVLALYRMIDSH